MSDHGQYTLEEVIGWNKSLHLKIEKLERDKTNLAESCIKLKETARLDRLQELAKMSERVEELYADKIEFDKLKEGIRNLNTYEMEHISRGYSIDYAMVDQDFPLKNEYRGDYVETEDLEKLLKGDN